MEELLERRLLVSQELDVVDEQHVDLAVFAVELVDAAFPARLVGTQRVDELVGELFARHIAHARAGLLEQRVVADRVEQMGLAQTRSAVDTQGVEVLARAFRHGERHGAREAVRIAGHEGVERVVAVEVRLRVERRLALAVLHRHLRERAGGGGHVEVRAGHDVFEGLHHGLVVMRGGLGRGGGTARRRFGRGWLRAARRAFGLDLRPGLRGARGRLQDLERGEQFDAAVGHLERLQQHGVEVGLQHALGFVVLHGQNDRGAVDRLGQHAFEPPLLPGGQCRVAA